MHTRTFHLSLILFNASLAPRLSPSVCSPLFIFSLLRTHLFFSFEFHSPHLFYHLDWITDDSKSTPTLHAISHKHLYRLYLNRRLITSAPPGGRGKGKSRPYMGLQQLLKWNKRDTLFLNETPSRQKHINVVRRKHRLGPLIFACSVVNRLKISKCVCFNKCRVILIKWDVLSLLLFYQLQSVPSAGISKSWHVVLTRCSLACISYFNAFGGNI